MDISFGWGVVLFLFSFFVQYVIIETAVRRGINSSVIGELIEKKYGIKEESTSILDDDLDKDK